MSNRGRKIQSGKGRDQQQQRQSSDPVNSQQSFTPTPQPQIPPRWTRPPVFQSSAPPQNFWAIPRQQGPPPQQSGSQSQLRPQTASSETELQSAQQSEPISANETLYEKSTQKLQDVQTTKSDSCTYAPKPIDKCSLGREIELTTNHYCFSVKKTFCLHQYDIKVFAKMKENVIKEVQNKEIKRGIFETLLKDIYKDYTNKIITDFGKILYSTVELTEPLSYNLTILNKEYEVKLIKTTIVNVDASRQIDPTVVNALQLSFTHNFSLNLISLGRSFFSLDGERKRIGFNINLWKGFFVSVRPSEMGLNINVDVANAAFFEEGKNIIDLATEFYKCRTDELVHLIDGRFESQLKNRKIKTHLGHTKKVDGFGPTAINHKFKQKNESWITVKDYFESQNIPISLPHLPCLKLGKENFVPMELCITARTNISKLTPREQSEMIKQTANPPHYRKNNIENMMKNLNLNEDPVLQELDIKVELRMTNLKGRVLQPPDLKFGQAKNRNLTILKSEEIGTQGSWRNNGRRFLSTFLIKSCLCINLSAKTSRKNIENFLNVVKNVSKDHGIDISNSIYVENFTKLDSNSGFKFIEEIYKINQRPSLILAILPGTSDIYKALKTFGDLKYGVTTQAINGETIERASERGFNQLASNICLKINPKTGGVNFILSKEARMFKENLGEYNTGKVMVFGADVNHTTGPDAESIAAVVGSIDSDFSHYAARLYAQRQPRGQALELIWDLGKMVSALLDEHQKKNNRYPERILFLRDGVSEGQFSQCLNNEMNQIREACALKSDSYKPAVTFVVVQKRHHTRFFAVNEQDTTKSGNILPGTLVDSKVVTPHMFDFFLCSHNGIKGTSKPCHYFVLHDENNFTINQISLFCHYLCHIYARSTTSVSYPAPTYYADLCAARGRDYLRQPRSGQLTTIVSYEIELHANFRDKMFFI